MDKNIEVISNVNIEIDDFVENFVNYVVKWYTYSDSSYEDLPNSLKDKIQQIIDDKFLNSSIYNSLPDLGEIISIVWNSRQNGDKLIYSNLTKFTHGKASERGLDAIFMKPSKDLYFWETKTNKVFNKKNMDGLLSSLNIQLDKRIKNKRQWIRSVADEIDILKKSDDENYHDVFNKIMSSISGKGMIVSHKHFWDHKTKNAFHIFSGKADKLTNDGVKIHNMLGENNE